MSSSKNLENTEKITIKKKGEIHFSKNFGEGTRSDRVILPEVDNCRIKMTEFYPKAGFEVKEGIVYDSDETVLLLSGKIEITREDGSQHEINAGGVYHVPAGVSYGIKVLTDSEIICLFSVAADGTLPDND